MESYYGLDLPLLQQYVNYLTGLLRGDLGQSVTENRPVLDLIAERLPWTLLLIGTAIGLASIVGVVAGIHSGWRRGKLRQLTS